jgi:serine/threonine protein kinase/Tol biopolymer transport system component
MTDWRLAHYEITAHLGSGGMGDVYEAKDTRLGRSVALKLVPNIFANDAARAARFEREARALAALNHPHIAAIHGLEQADGRTFLVMELVPGRTLEERIARSPPPVDEALGLATQIAEALEAAHAKGVVHRDLKPANIKVTPDGRAKVLDFGLAKLIAPPASADAPSTVTTLGTEVGTVLGTAPYMAPEQARGLDVDQRADVFAFGCVLYEMLTGKRAFDGDSATDIVSRILQTEPDWALLPGGVSPSIRRLLKLCLEKDPRKRRQSAGDVRVDLEHASAEPPEDALSGRRPQRSRHVRVALLALGAVVVAALAIPWVVHLRESSPPEMRVELVTPPTHFPLDFALSPDGRQIAFVAKGPNDTEMLHVRALSGTESRPLPGTEGARHPFWSPDGRSLGFFAAGVLSRIDIAGGRKQALYAAQVGQGGSWNADGTILFTQNTVSPVFRIPAGGGEAVAVTRLDAERHLGHRFPSFLPDGRHFLFYAQAVESESGIYLASLDGDEPKRLGAADTAARYFAPDRVLYVQQEALVARKLEVARAELLDEPVTLAKGVGADFFQGGFSVSAGGMVAHRGGSSPRGQLTWFDRSGQVLSQGGDINGPELSPDDRRLAFDRTLRSNRDVWLMDIARGSLTPLTFDAAVDGYPVWSPDGAQLAFESTRNGTFDMWIKAVNAAEPEQLLLSTPDGEWPLNWSSDGRYLLYQSTDFATKWDLYALPMTGEAREPIAIASTPFAERMGVFSPDARWVAFETDDTGQPEIVAQAFPVAKGRLAISTAGGSAPRWSADGKEIFFIAPDGTLMSVPVTATESTFEAGTPVPLFSPGVARQIFKAQYAVSRDGRFIVDSLVKAPLFESPITLILNRAP